ncbi:MAG: transposase [Chloroflexi bacterium]|nr:transposase [Chloroflexota bacterium]
MTKQRRKFTAEFKAKVVLEVLSGRSSIAVIARRHQLQSKLIYQWRAEVLENLPLLFTLHQANPASEARIAELERLIGQLTIENEVLKKASAWLTRPSRLNGRS